jgi:hypothetical protein
VPPHAPLPQRVPSEAAVTVRALPPLIAPLAARVAAHQAIAHRAVGVRRVPSRPVRHARSGVLETSAATTAAIGHGGRMILTFRVAPDHRARASAMRAGRADVHGVSG